MLVEQLPNLLIVDDVRVNLKLLESIIRRVKVNLIQALSGSEALEKTRGIELALAIIDVHMLGMNGYELAVKMNEERSGNKVPVIFLTANFFDKMEVLKGYGSGAVDYIFKPVESHILLSKINVFLDLFNQKQKISRDAALLKESADKLTQAIGKAQVASEKYTNLYNFAPSGYFTLSKDGEIIELNLSGANIFNKERSYLINSRFDFFISQDTLPIFNVFFLNVFKGKDKEICEIILQIDGTQPKFVHIEGVVVGDGKQCLINVIDITKRKKIEEELKSSLMQLHQLTQYIEKVREDERVAISRELHDDLGQALTAVKIDLKIISQNISDKAIILKMNKVSALVSETIKTVQRLTSQLRPQIIEDLGLETAIEWYTNEFEQRNGVEVLLDMDSEIAISPDASLVIFRIMQESLTNVSRHAGATHVNICLHKTEGTISFRISDNGIGITENAIQSKKSFGIISMKERALLLGGTLDIYREKEHGTVIKLALPLNNKWTYENFNL